MKYKRKIKPTLLAFMPLNAKCEICNTKDKLSVHHIRPRREGGDEDPENLIVLCRLHHNIVESENLEIMKKNANVLDKYYLLIKIRNIKATIRSLEYNINKLQDRANKIII